MLKIEALENLVAEFSKLPGVGPRSAERLAYHILRSPKLRAESLASALIEAKNSVKECSQCFNYTDSTLCYYCQTPRRDDHTLCVVQDPSTIEKMEGSGVFHGRYHVLHGTIAPLMGVTPDKLRIHPLVERVHRSLSQQGPPLHEIIFALDSDLEGDTTLLYISDCLKNLPLKLSRLAQGVPVGGGMTYLDERTLGSALQNRVEIHPNSGFDRN
jgi:recombination protein RecR